MKVAQFINSSDSGGAETQVVEISKELSNRGIENVVFHFGNEWIDSKLKVPHYLLKPSSIKDIVGFGWLFGNTLMELDVTHLHSHLYGATVRGVIAAREAKIPHIATQHDIYTIKDKESRIRWLKVASLLGTKLITVSKQMEQTYKDIGNKHNFCSFKNNEIQTIYNGVDTEKFQPQHVLSMYADLFRIISVGRLEEVKNYKLLIRAINALVSRGIYNIKLSLVGDGQLRKELEELTISLGMAPWISFLGARDDIPQLLNKSDLFVLPSFTEGLSCSILEAMSCGLPVVASNVGGNNELVVPNITGWLFESDNLGDLVEKLEDVISNRECLFQQRHASRREIEFNFSIKTMVNQYLGAYTEK